MQSHIRGTGREREDGAAAVEFALILVPLLVILFGIMQYGFYFFAWQVGSSTAREVTRKVAVGDCQDNAELNNFVQARLGAASVGGVVVDRAYTKADDTPIIAPAPAEIGGRVSVTITFDTLDLNFPFIPLFNDGKITKVVDARVEDLIADGGCS